MLRLPKTRLNPLVLALVYAVVAQAAVLLSLVRFPDAGELTASVLVFASGTLIYLALKRKEASNANTLAAGLPSEVRYRHAFNVNPNPLWVFDEETLFFLAVNPAACRLYGYSASEFKAMRVTQLYPREELNRFGDELIAPSPGTNRRWTHVQKDGTPRTVEVVSSTLKFSGRPARMAFIVDVTGKLHDVAEAQLAAVAFGNVGEAIAVLDDSGRFMSVNTAFEQLTRFSGTEVLGKSAHFLVTGGARHLLHALAGSGKADGEAWCRRRGAPPFLVQLSVRAAHTTGDKVSHYVAVARDLSAQRAAEASIHRLAFYDGLTALPNRNLLENRVRQAIAAHKRNAEPFAMLFVDLDNFKAVNDSLGHLAGDSLLQTAARAIHGAVREADTASRWGGDEFVVLLPASDLQAAMGIAERILRALDTPGRFNDRPVALGASIGVALFPRDGADFETLLKNASIAMHHAKALGRNRWQLYSVPATGKPSDTPALAGALRKALNAGTELEVHYQPQVAIGNGAVVGFEALVRWKHPQLGWISPEKFILIAETNGYIAMLGYWVLTQACRDLKTISALGFERAKMAVNVSVVQLRDAHFADRCLAIAAECGIAATRLELEVTESVMLHDREAIIPQFVRLREHGVTIVVDDFGTGYSSLAYLQQLPIDKVKIDRSFVAGLAAGTGANALVRVIIGLAHLLRLHCVAEGVETALERDTLTEHQCDYAQGHLFARPMPLPVLHAWLAEPGRIQGHHLPRAVLESVVDAALPLVPERARLAS